MKLSELGRFIDAAPNATALLDADMRYIAASAGWLKTHGLTRDIIGGSHCDAFPDLPDDWKARHRRALAGESLKADGNCNIAGLGRQQWLDWNMEPWRLSDSRIGGILVFVDDVAAQKIVERAAREAEIGESRRKSAVQAQEVKGLAEAAAAANKAKAAFLAAMSHELRTPLNVVVGFADLIANSDDPEMIKSYASSLRGSARRLNAIVDDILDFTRLEAGDLALRVAPFNLDDLAARAYSAMTRLVAGKNIALTLVVDPGLPRALLGDFGRVMQILLHLLGNAAKFTQQGSIALRISRQGSSATKTTVRFEVSDTGPGVGDTVRTKLFEAFVQGETVKNARAEGTGLGLTISSRLAWLMGGDIDLDTEIGRGSRFSLEAPFEIAEPAAVGSNAPADACACEAKRPLRILVVEDTAPSRILLRIMLTARGHMVIEANNGAAAVEAVWRQRFDLILMDIQMPVMDGVTAARLIRRLPEPAASTPIVAVTADASEDQCLKCREAGIDGVIVKPLTEEALNALLSCKGRENARQTAAKASGDERSPADIARDAERLSARRA